MAKMTPQQLQISALKRERARLEERLCLAELLNMEERKQLWHAFNGTGVDYDLVSGGEQRRRRPARGAAQRYGPVSLPLAGQVA